MHYFGNCSPGNIYNLHAFVRKFNIFLCGDELEARKIEKFEDNLSF